jgi:hypothetical protein
MREGTDSCGVAGAAVLRFFSVCTLAVATICSTFPAPVALADSGREILLAQAYPPSSPPPPVPQVQVQPPPAYPPTEPPPAGYQPAPSYAPPGYGVTGYGQLPNPNETAQAEIDGRADANTEISGVLWFCVGFFLTWIGIILGYLLTPTPDGTRLIGKSPNYVTAYTSAYQSEGRSFQGIHAVYGCVTSGVIEIVAVVLLFAFEFAALGSLGAGG